MASITIQAAGLFSKVVSGQFNKSDQLELKKVAMKIAHIVVAYAIFSNLMLSLPKGVMCLVGVACLYQGLTTFFYQESVNAAVGYWLCLACFAQMNNKVPLQTAVTIGIKLLTGASLIAFSKTELLSKENYPLFGLSRGAF